MPTFAIASEVNNWFHFFDRDCVGSITKDNFREAIRKKRVGSDSNEASPNFSVMEV